MYQRCLKTILFPLKTNIKKAELYFTGLDLLYGTPDIGFPSCEIEKENFSDSQEKQSRIETRNPWNLKF